MRGILAFLLLIPFAAGPSGARTWTVAPDGTADFVSIQEAIDASTTGDVIEIQPGVYHELINTWGDDIDLIGLQGPEVTIVDADRGGAALTIPFTPGGSPLIQGLTFQDGIGKLLREGPREGRYGGGVYVEVAYVEFEDCVFRGNDANVGGGIYVQAGAPQFVDCVISGNRAGRGGGIAIEHDGGVRFKNCSIIGNEAVFGGGLYLFHSILQMDACEVRGNLAAEGGAMRLQERGPGFVWIRDSVLSDNSAGEAGSIQILGADLGVIQSTIARNTGTQGTSNIQMVDSELWLTSTVVETLSEGDLIACQGGRAKLECVVLWSPSGEPVDCIKGGPSLFADPLFCDPAHGNYRLQSESPCLPGQGPPGCDRIGARTRGCPMPAQRIETDWGGSKSNFR